MGILQTAVYVGTIGGGFLAGLIAQHYGWRRAFLVLGGAGVVLGMIILRTLREPHRGAADLEQENSEAAAPPLARVSARQSLRLVLATPSAVLIMGGFTCGNFVALVLLSWMPKFLYDKFHLSLAVAGLTATLYAQAASMVGADGWLT